MFSHYFFLTELQNLIKQASEYTFAEWNYRFVLSSYEMQRNRNMRIKMELYGIETKRVYI